MLLRLMPNNKLYCTILLFEFHCTGGKKSNGDPSGDTSRDAATGQSVQGSFTPAASAQVTIGFAGLVTFVGTQNETLSDGAGNTFNYTAIQWGASNNWVIKSAGLQYNFQQGAQQNDFTTAGAFFDLQNGIIRTPFFYSDSQGTGIGTGAYLGQQTVSQVQQGVSSAQTDASQAQSAAIKAGQQAGQAQQDATSEVNKLVKLNRPPLKLNRMPLKLNRMLLVQVNKLVKLNRPLLKLNSK